MFSSSQRPVLADSAIVYDGECPVCSQLFRVYLRARENKLSIRLIDARQTPALYDYLLREQKIDLDRDFALYRNSAWYSGGAALGILYFEGSRNKLVKWCGIQFLRMIYPLLRAGRRLLLFILRRTTLRDQMEKLRS
jgi:predicted DCC family thiol-disulfide oxidoreductase YuxK